VLPDSVNLSGDRRPPWTGIGVKAETRTIRGMSKESESIGQETDRKDFSKRHYSSYPQ